MQIHCIEDSAPSNYKSRPSNKGGGKVIMVFSTGRLFSLVKARKL